MTMPEQASWKVEFYRDARGHSPAWEFLQQLPGVERAKLLAVIDLLQEFGVSLRFPHTRLIEKGLWELRAGPGRLFYVALVGRRLVILHGYRKKSQKAPRREIEAALRRWADLLEREK